jgi:hypothetical protein
MARFKTYGIFNIVLCALLLCSYQAGIADDTCVFMVTADDVPPNIVILLDNGAEMEQIIHHSDYDSSLDYTPSVAPEADVVSSAAGAGNGFFHDNGYSIIITGNKYYLVDIPDSLLVAGYTYQLQADGDGKNPVWTINGRTVTLPAIPSTVIVDGVKDNATNFRYAKNYLNWIFFSGDYTGDGTDLPNVSRFYYAKKALMTVAKLTANQAQFGIYNFTSNASGASNVQPLGMVVNTPLAALPENNNLDPNYVNNVNNMGTVAYSPLAEGLARVGGYYGSPSSGVVASYCQKNFVIVVTPGVSSEDQATAAGSSPAGLADYDGDNGSGGIVEGYIQEDDTSYTIPLNQNGSTYLDDVAYYLYSHDIVDYRPGFQNILTYTIGFMGDAVANLFLINSSNNGNGNLNLYDTSHEEYAKYHYEAQNPNELAARLLAAVNDILSATSSFTAPVVPVTRTTSGNRMYMAFFKPVESNFWEGNVVKFGISATNEIVDKNGNPATWPNGAIREDSVPYWQTKDWANPAKANYIHNSSRNIYTYMGSTTDLTDSSNHFSTANSNLSAIVLGNPIRSPEDIINYVRGADVLDENKDGNTTENRRVITGDVLHSEPLVIRYSYADGTAESYVFYGANDGMLHAVRDAFDPDVNASDDETDYGYEAWAFIPPDQLHRLKQMVEANGHQYYIDSSPKLYFKDVNQNGLVDHEDGDQMILICGERMGGIGYFALDVTYPEAPQYLWRIAGSESGVLQLDNITVNNGGSFQEGNPIRIWDGMGAWGPAIAAYADSTMTANQLRFGGGLIPFAANQWIGNLTTEIYNDYMYNAPADWSATPFVWGRIVAVTTANANVIIPELGQSWSEPQFGLVKTSAEDDTGTAVFFIGGGYSSDNSAGKAVLAINVFTGQVVKKFQNNVSITAMNYSIPSSVTVIDENDNGFVDKLYVGDLGGQMWRIGQFEYDSNGEPLVFPDSDENINTWTAQRVFQAPSYVVGAVTYHRKFYYPPSVTLEVGYDLLFVGTGDRDDACNRTTSDRFYVIKDDHSNTLRSESDLVDVTNPDSPAPSLDNPYSDADSNGTVDQGWYIRLAGGEKVLAENTVFFKTVYLTTFTPNDDPCLPGGLATLYALNYKTGAAVIDVDGDGTKDRSVTIGGGIPSKVVMVITDSSGSKIFISVGSTNPDENSEAFDAGVVNFDPLAPLLNFHYIWWREVLSE